MNWKSDQLTQHPSRKLNAESSGIREADQEYLDFWTEYFGCWLLRDVIALSVCGRTDVIAFTNSEWNEFVRIYQDVIGEFIAYEMFGARIN